MKDSPALPYGIRPASTLTVRGWVATVIASGMQSMDTTGMRSRPGETRSEILARLAVERADALIAIVARTNGDEWQAAVRCDVCGGALPDGAAGGACPDCIADAKRNGGAA